MEVHKSLSDKQIETSFAKTERTDLVRIRSGQQPAIRRWHHFVGSSEDAVCRLCGEEVKFVGHLWLRFPAQFGGTTPLQTWPCDGRTRPSSACKAHINCSFQL